MPSRAQIIALAQALLTEAQALPGGGNGQTPPGDPLVVLLPSAHFHQQPTQAFKFDLVPQSRLAPRGVPFDSRLLYDAVNGVIAPPLAGAAVTSMHVLPLLGAPTTLYSQVPYFRPLSAGDPYSGLSDPFNPEMGDDFAVIVADLKARPMTGGERGIALATTYCNVLPHPNKFDASLTSNQALWGTPIPRAPTASVFDHAGNLWLLYVRAAVSGKSKVEYVFAGKLPGVNFLHYACSDRTDRATVYGCDLGAKNASGVWSGGRVFRADRGAGKGTATSGEDASKYTITDELALGYPSCVESDDAGNLYAVDAASGNVWRKLKGGAWLNWMVVPNAFALDCANGKITVVGRDMSVREIDAAGTLGPNLMPAQYVTTPFALGVDFATVSVDRNGTCGPVGGVRVSRVHTVGNTNLWQFTPGLASVKFGQQIFLPSMQGWLDVGPVSAVKEPHGHYDWLGGKYHPWQGISFHGGFANVPFSVIAHNAMWIPVQSPLPGPNGNYLVIYRGKRVLTEQGLTTMVSREGWSPFAGCSFDEMAELAKTQGFDALKAFLQGGMISITPRPNLVGVDLVCLMALIICNSAFGMAEGKPFVDAFLTWAGPIPNPAVTGGLPSSFVPESAKYLEARQVTPGHYRVGVFGLGGSTPVRYTTLHEDHATAIPADAVVVANEGTPFEAVLAGGDGSALPVGQHALTVRSASMQTRAIAVRV